MKKMVTAALMLSLLSGTSAFAQQSASGDPREGRGSIRERLAERRAEKAEKKEEKAEAKDERREDRAPARPAAARPAGERAEVAAEVRARLSDRAEVREDRREDRQDRREDRRDDRQDRREDRRDDRQDRREDRVIVAPQVRTDSDRRERTFRPQVIQQAPAFRRPGEGRKLRDRDRDRSWYDASRYRRAYHAKHRYRASRYIYPSGWYVRVWNFGDRLPHSSWYSNRYYLDWWRYSLPRPPIGTEWIRMRDDAILVDVWTGRVLAVYHDLFW